jgi:hypothetical protein
MSAFERLLACAGRWHGPNRVQTAPEEAAEDSQSTAVITRLLQDRFVRIDYTWSWQTTPQKGSFLIGHDPKSSAITAHWIDTFHNGHKVMACKGIARPDGILDVLGGYAAPPGPDWGWRITIAPDPPNRLEITMYNIHPTGQEDFGVQTTLVRA